MDEKFEKLFAMMAEMKAGLEDKMEAGQEKMKAGQEEMKAGLEKEMEAGQERMEQVQEEMKDLIRAGKEEMRAHVVSQVEGIKDHVNGCIGRMEEEVQGVKGKIEEVKTEVHEKMSDLERRLSDIETRPNNFPANPEFLYLRPTVKPLTFNMLTSWTVVKTQFDVVSSTNGWMDSVKASQLVALLRGSAVEVLQGIPADKLTDLTAIEKALESRFGDSHLTQFYRTELKTRRQKPGESLQVLAADVERLMSLAYGECPQDVRDSLAVQNFIDAIKDEEMQLSTRLIDFTLGSTQHRKRTSDGKNVLSRRLCLEGCEPCSNAEKKFRMETDISVEASTMTTENRWSLNKNSEKKLSKDFLTPEKLEDPSDNNIGDKIDNSFTHTEPAELNLPVEPSVLFVKTEEMQENNKSNKMKIETLKPFAENTKPGKKEESDSSDSEESSSSGTTSESGGKHKKKSLKEAKKSKSESKKSSRKDKSSSKHGSRRRRSRSRDSESSEKHRRERSHDRKNSSSKKKKKYKRSDSSGSSSSSSHRRKRSSRYESGHSHRERRSRSYDDRERRRKRSVSPSKVHSKSDIRSSRSHRYSDDKYDRKYKDEKKYYDHRHSPSPSGHSSRLPRKYRSRSLSSEGQSPGKKLKKYRNR
ncbi:hypothetical protein AVEN_105967-1 [Araneus ventricosus]|uniref:Uncharacterized protein n=1 Tax=Araneus ventricosus TaxID=182803 RepID=A0A4Y2DV54_ARAVE|nr:hypothetical protein AVEN_105967-1 [Araneus ventricosus]